MADKLSAIFALFAVTWKITLTDQKSRFKKWDAKPFLRIIHDVISIFRLHFPQKAGMNGLPQNLASTPNRPSARCKTILCLSTRPYRRNAEELKSYAVKAMFKGEFKKADTQTNLPSRTNCFLPRKFRNAQN